LFLGHWHNHLSIFFILGDWWHRIHHLEGLRLYLSHRWDINHWLSLEWVIYWSNRLGLYRATLTHWVSDWLLRRIVHWWCLEGHVLGCLHSFFDHFILDIVKDLVRKHVDDSAERLLVLNLKVFLVVSHDYVKKVLVMKFHSVAFEVVILKLILECDSNTALACEFKDAPLWLLERALVWHTLRHPWRRSLVPIRQLGLNKV